MRLRFGLRAAQRYTRAAVPDMLAGKVIVPLKGLITGDAVATELFAEWALFHGDEREQKPGILAIYRANIDETRSEAEQATQEDAIRQQAEDEFHAIVEALPEEARSVGR